jgi:pSer/pThr/pTyr-binding forkhead associated (FHA) protein
LKLIFYFHDGNIEEFSSDKDSVIIGRGKSCDVVLPMDGFSRQHARIELIAGDIFVTDLESTNGVYIDGERIPANQKTKMQSFLSLQIGPASRIEVLEDELEIETSSKLENVNNSALGSFGRSAPVSDNKSSSAKENLAKTKPLKTKKATVEKPKSINPNFIIATSLVIFGVVYYQMNSNTQDISEAQVQVAQAPQEQGPPLTEVNFLPKENLESLFFQKSCEGDLAKWCQAAGVLSSSYEGVVIQGKSLIVYYNLMFFKDEKFHPQFDSLPEAKKMEVLLLRRIFSLTLVRTLQRQTQFDNFQAVGAYMGDQQFSPVIALKVKRDVDFKNLDKFSLMGVFDLIVNQGAIEELSAISNAYEPFIFSK